MKKMLFSGVLIMSMLGTQLAFADAAPPPIPQTPQGTNAFSDVAVGSTYYDAVLYLKNQGVISGYSDGTFKPKNTINRAEFTKIAVEGSPGFVNNGLCMETFADKGPNYNIFKDVITSDNAWYLENVCYAFLNHWISGYPDGTFRPNQEISFVEAAKIIANVYKLSIPAVTSSDPWYKGYVEALASQKAIPMTISNFAQNITRGEMAEIIYRIKSQNTSLPSHTYTDLTQAGSTAAVAPPKFNSFEEYLDFVLKDASAKSFMTNVIPQNFHAVSFGANPPQDFSEGKTTQPVYLYTDKNLEGPGHLSDPMNFYLRVGNNYYGLFAGTVDFTQ